MSLIYDLYQPGDSWLHRLDPRCKLVWTLCACTLLLLWRNLWLIAGLLLLTQVVLLSAGISRERIGWVWRLTLPTMIMITLMWLLFYHGTGRSLFTWRFIEVTTGNLAEALAMGLRLGALAFAVFCWLFSSDQDALVQGLVAMGLPYRAGLTLAISLRYLPTMANAFRTISDAQQARGLDLSEGGMLRRAKAYVPITIAMFISAIRTAERLAHALESRGLGAREMRTSLHPLTWSQRDGLVTVAGLTLTALLLAARLVYGFGATPL